MASRWKRFFVAANRWPDANPWKFSLGVGVLMFFIGWWGHVGRLGNGVIAGVIWGVVFFAVTAANLWRGRPKTS
jgi:hypothetical protein